MIRYKWLILSLLLLSQHCAQAQKKSVNDTLDVENDALIGDSLFDYDDLFRDFDAFMDSLLTPRSYSLISLSHSKAYFNYVSKSEVYSVSAVKQSVLTPLVGYYHKNGLGITATGYLTNDAKRFTLFQGSVSGTYDYLKNRNLATGFSFSRFVTKKEVAFYTTPLQNELYTYFTYRKWWLRPTIAASYGWGSRSAYAEREEIIQDLRLRRRGFTYINTKETVNDFAIISSLRHDFYWLDVWKKKDYIRFTPQLTFTSGTQKFGFNQSSSTYVTLLRNNSNILYSSENLSLDDNLKFQALSLSLFLRGEYALGKCFIQPQLAIDYYFPGSSKKVTTLFSVNAGFIL
jgi:hypothetical protein